MRVIATKEITFDSAHQLPGYDGLCANVHGHTYKLQVGVACSDEALLEECGMVIDFTKLSELLKGVKEQYDHQFINAFMANPTAENMACNIFFEIRAAILAHFPKRELVSVKLWETPTSFVEVTA